MLNVKALCELLTKYSDDKLCGEWFLMTENGTVLAYSDSTNVDTVRKHAAWAISFWKKQVPASEDDDNHNHDHGEPAESSGKPLKPEGMYLETLTLEMVASNMIISKIRPELLLVMNGNPPRRGENFKPREGTTWRSTAFSNQHDGKPQFGSEHHPSTSLGLDATSDTFADNLLELQRQRVDTVARELTRALDEGGFEMPDQSVNETI